MFVATPTHISTLQGHMVDHSTCKALCPLQTLQGKVSLWFLKATLCPFWSLLRDHEDTVYLACEADYRTVPNV